MEKRLTIRPYCAQDLTNVMHLFKLNTPNFFSPDEENDLKQYLKEEVELYFLVFLGQVHVGCGGVNFLNDSTIARISWDFFHPEYQGRKLGSQLLQFRLDLIKNMNHVQSIEVRTSQHVYGFYEKHGFQLVEIQQDYWAKGFDLYAMKYAQN